MSSQGAALTLKALKYFLIKTKSPNDFFNLKSSYMSQLALSASIFMGLRTLEMFYSFIARIDFIDVRI